MIRHLVASAALAALCTSPAQAMFVAESDVPIGTLRYEGLGDLGGGVGSGRYFLGDCAQAGGSTLCTLSGSYVEAASSTRLPGDTGTFELTMSFPGVGPNPIIARSRIAGSDELQLNALGSGSFALKVLTSDGTEIGGLFPDTPFSNSIGWSAFLKPGAFACTGLTAGQACNISTVGLTAGAVISGDVSPVFFSVPLVS